MANLTNKIMNKIGLAHKDQIKLIEMNDLQKADFNIIADYIERNLQMNVRDLNAEQRVANGTAWLDAHFAGWEKRIDVDTLELNNGHLCICGQVFNDNECRLYGFSYALSNLFSEAALWLKKLGFIINGDDIKKQYTASDIMGFTEGYGVTFEELEKAWKDLLWSRGR